MPLEIRVFVRRQLIQSISDASFPPPPPPPPPPGPIDPNDPEIMVDLDVALRPGPQRYDPVFWHHAIRCLRDRNWNPGTHPLSAAAQGHTEIDVSDGVSLRVHTSIVRDARGLCVRIRASSDPFGVEGQIIIRRY